MIVTAPAPRKILSEKAGEKSQQKSVLIQKQSESVRTRSGSRCRTFPDRFLFGGLCALIVLGLNVGLFQAWSAQSRIALMLEGGVPFEISLEKNISEGTLTTFLQALAALPQVRGAQYQPREDVFTNVQAAYPAAVDSLAFKQNPLADRVRVTLGSLGDVGAFYAFLSRPELSGFVGSSYIVDIPERYASLSASIQNARMHQTIGLTISVSAIILLFGALVLFARSRAGRMEHYLRITTLFGASKARSLKPLYADVSMILLFALPLGFFYSVVVLLSVWPQLLSAANIFAVMTAEVFLIAFLAWCAIRSISLFSILHRGPFAHC